MKAIDILIETSNVCVGIKKYVVKYYEGYRNALNNAGYDSPNYKLAFHDGKIKDGDSVFVTDVNLSEKANIIIENNKDTSDKVYLYNLK